MCAFVLLQVYADICVCFGPAECIILLAPMYRWLTQDSGTPDAILSVLYKYKGWDCQSPPTAFLPLPRDLCVPIPVWCPRTPSRHRGFFSPSGASTVEALREWGRLAAIEVCMLSPQQLLVGCVQGETVKDVRP